MSWIDVIKELVGLGWTQARIAQECQCGQMTISDLLTGKTANPKFTTGRALLDLLTRARKDAKRKSAKAA